MLVEDKLGALAARMDFLASETRDKIYHSSSTSTLSTSDTTETTRATAQTPINLLLDILPINLEDVSKSTSPPIQLKQYVRYLQLAGKHTITAQNEALSLPNAVRTAIGEETETPAPNTRSPNGALDELRALQWRMLMIKRGMQRVVQAGSATHTQLSAMSASIRNAMRLLTHARDCIEDLEENGPRSESALALLEEMERTTDGSVMLELRREVERRLDAGVAWKRVDEELKKQEAARKSESAAKSETESHGKCPILCRLRIQLRPALEPKVRYVYRHLRRIELGEELPRVPQRNNPDGTPSWLHDSWRKRQLGRTRNVVNNSNKHVTALHLHIGTLETFHPGDTEKIAHLREAKHAVDPTIGLGLEAACNVLRPKARFATCRVWTHLLNDRREEVEKIKAQLRNTDGHLRAYRRTATDESELSKDVWKTLLSAKLELYIAYDVIWRLARRLGQDVADMREIATQVDDDEEYEEVFTKSDKPVIKEVNRTRSNTAAKALHNVFDDDPN